MERPRFDLGRIIRDYGEECISRFNPVPQVRKTFAALSICRTAALGGHKEVCPECGEIHISYDSCRDRHCPKCQHKEREQWIEMRREEVIPGVRYFHVVFTVPACLNQLAMSYQALFYSCMFRAGWNTLKTFYASQGLQGGMTSILHTWGSALSYHPHIHCIVTGGGVDKDGVWHHLDGCKDGRNFLFPVHALSKMFRAKFMAMLTSDLKKEGVEIPKAVRKQCFGKAWNINSRPPAKGVNMVLEYIGRYAYRTAISNSRILDYNAEDGMVTYDWKDYRDNARHKTKRMHAVDFIHLFSLHVLPPGFVRIRHYGVLSPSNRDKIRSVQIQQGGDPVPKRRRKKSYQQICDENGWVIGICPKCGCKMVMLERIEPSRAPPVVAPVQPAATARTICL